MVDLSVLDWLIDQSHPLEVEVSILKVNLSGSNEVITEDHIVVHHLNCQRRGSWELSFELISLVEFGTWLIELVVVSLIKGLPVASQSQVRVRGRSVISARKVES